MDLKVDDAQRSGTAGSLVELSSCLDAIVSPLPVDGVFQFLKTSGEIPLTFFLQKVLNRNDGGGVSEESVEGRAARVAGDDEEFVLLRLRLVQIGQGESSRDVGSEGDHADQTRVALGKREADGWRK